jgi:hypothetical protein
MRTILAGPAGGRLPACQHGCNRCEEVTPVKTRREVLRLPVDVPAASHCSTALDQFEQTVSRADMPAVVGLDNNGRARPADVWIDDAKKDGTRRKSCSMDCQQVGRCLRVANGEQVNNGCGRHHLMQHRLDLTVYGPCKPKSVNNTIMLQLASWWRAARKTAGLDDCHMYHPAATAWSTSMPATGFGGEWIRKATWPLRQRSLVGSAC